MDSRIKGRNIPGALLVYALLFLFLIIGSLAGYLGGTYLLQGANFILSAAEVFSNVKGILHGRASYPGVDWEKACALATGKGK